MGTVSDFVLTVRKAFLFFLTTLPHHLRKYEKIVTKMIEHVPPQELPTKDDFHASTAKLPHALALR